MKQGYLKRIDSTLYVGTREILPVDFSFQIGEVYFYKVLEGYETWNGCYFFLLSEVSNDGFAGGFVQLGRNKWKIGRIDMNDLKKHKGRVWPIPEESLPYSGQTLNEADQIKLMNEWEKETLKKKIQNL